MIETKARRRFRLTHLAFIAVAVTPLLLVAWGPSTGRPVAAAFGLSSPADQLAQWRADGGDVMTNDLATSLYRLQIEAQSNDANRILTACSRLRATALTLGGRTPIPDESAQRTWISVLEDTRVAAEACMQGVASNDMGQVPVMQSRIVNADRNMRAVNGRMARVASVCTTPGQVCP